MDPLAAVVDFHKQLQARGVELLVVPVPPKALVHPELLPALYGEDELAARTAERDVGGGVLAEGHPGVA